MLSVLSSARSWPIESMLRWSAGFARSLCSGGDTFRTRQRCVLQPSVSLSLQSLFVRAAFAQPPTSSHSFLSPTAPTRLHTCRKRHQPRWFVVVPSVAVMTAVMTAVRTRTLSGRRVRLGCSQNAPQPQSISPGCPPEYGACDHSTLCRRRNREAPFFRGSNRLRVQRRRTGRGLASFLKAHLLIKRIMNQLPCPIIAPTPKVFPRDIPRHQIVRQQAPRTTRSQLIKNGVDHFAQRVFAGASGTTILGFGPDRLKALPLFVTQIRRIPLASCHASKFSMTFYTHSEAKHALIVGVANWDLRKSLQSRCLAWSQVVWI